MPYTKCPSTNYCPGKLFYAFLLPLQPLVLFGHQIQMYACLGYKCLSILSIPHRAVSIPQPLLCLFVVVGFLWLLLFLFFVCVGFFCFHRLYFLWFFAL